MSDFGRVVDLEADESEDGFVGPASPDVGARTYGGHVIAQSLAAAQLTTEPDRAVHSIHSYFLKAGDASRSLELRVERMRDGRSFSQRQVVAHQAGVEVMRSLISFHVPEVGLEWEESRLGQPPPPTRERPYTDYSDLMESLLAPEERPWPGRDRPMDVRHVNPPTLVEGQGVTEAQQMWMRVHGPLGDDRSVHDTGLAYLADLGMNPMILLPHGHRWSDERITEASLDHAMWFHRPARADEWLLYEQRPESTAQGRGLASGRFYDQEGQLIATCMQEGLMRWRDERSVL